MRSQKDEISCLLGSNALDIWYRVSFCCKSDVSPSALYLGRSMQSPVLSSFVSFGCWMPRLSLVCWLSDILSSLLNLGLWYQSMQSPFGEIFELSSQPFLFLILLKPCEYCSYPLLRVGLKKRCSTLFRSQYRIMSLLTKEPGQILVWRGVNASKPRPFFLWDRRRTKSLVFLDRMLWIFDTESLSAVSRMSRQARCIWGDLCNRRCYLRSYLLDAGCRVSP